MAACCGKEEDEPITGFQSHDTRNDSVLYGIEVS